MANPKMTLAELEPSEEPIIVSRVLVQLHKAIDDYFPATADAGDQFKRTVFSTEESTETGKMAAPVPISELESQIAESKAAEAPRALERRARQSAPAEQPDHPTSREFFEGETMGRKPFEHSIESKPDVVSIFAIIVFILGLMGVAGLIFLLFL